MLNGIEHIDEIRALINNKRTGLITNHTGVNSRMVSTVDLLHEHLTCLFGPEHGIRGAVQDELHVGHSIDPVTRLPEFSLFGSHLSPDKQMLDIIIWHYFDGLCIGDVAEKSFTSASSIYRKINKFLKYDTGQT